MGVLLRSLLFVPAADDRLFDSACTKGSDAVILDLEDGTHATRKAAAREGLQARYQRLETVGKAVAVRVNGDLLTLVQDLRAAVWPGLDLLVLPKVEHARDVQLIATAVATLEAERGLAPGHVRLLLQIESAVALPRLHDIAAAHPRVMGMMLGSEDFSLDLGGLPGEDLLLTPSLMVLHAARAAGIQPIGFVASIAALGDVDSFRRVLDRARTLGFRGAVIVHPKFIEAVNDCYTPSAEQLAQAQAIVNAFDAADKQGLGAVRVGELMVDKPVYRRALGLLANAPHQPSSDQGNG
ncbi:MAG: HpcH/HpaI aldolase/citrate lyase family protein [Inhella sp.]|uniref:HpcH/HpaI aldolase/citrate lyase family protein n=1 Tax=Inhella sp. TaxID=1921806 RepID=UPI00391D38A8